MKRPAAAVAPLLFCSGACALVYQVAWFREFRLVFGASTAASAAVLAIFIGGLGAGGLLLGKRADRHPRPLELYSTLEIIVALTAAATPALLWVIRKIYIATGGTFVLGMAGGTLLRLGLATLVLLVPTICMGGTLPAAVRAIETEDDQGRRRLALLYGVNTLGAVTGSLLATFSLLEVFGTRMTVWVAALLNLLVAVVARTVARRLPATTEPLAPLDTPTPTPTPGPTPVTSIATPLAPAWFALAAAALVGFAFFLMELVWYRMLGPLLGGTVFTFGLILAVALLGIGLGGFCYSLFGSMFGRARPATLAGFAYTCLLEAACIAIPFAIGDRIAVWALLLRPLGVLGFDGHLVSWTVITMLVVFPAAFVSGVQFPMLIALLGRGRRDVGKQIGQAYAWNTGGAILGSLAGGFGLLPLLTAPGCWRAVAVVLAALGLAAIVLSARLERRWLRLAFPVATAGLVAWLLTATGPTAVWRHSPIGTGRVAARHTTSPNALRGWMESQRRAIIWEAEGTESSVAIDRLGGLSFVLNGKIDGNARTDAPTQVMSGMLGALLHPAPKKAMVIGLGTGSTAGWLGVVPGMERVDVVELEPAILDVARMCAPVNQDVMANPRVNTMTGDAREFLLTTPEKYDIIFSEPSNPYRAGIASLFTREYYQAANDRLQDGGLFLQWVQGYDIDSQTVRTVYATLSSVFPVVETWQIHEYDMMLVASRAPVTHDAAALRARLASEPFRAAARNAWRVDDLEGVLARYVAAPPVARAVSAAFTGELNTDDKNTIEFGFARSVQGVSGLFEIDEIRALAAALGGDRPAVTGEIDWTRVEDQRVMITQTGFVAPKIPAHLSPEQRARAAAYAAHLDGKLAEVAAAWRAQPREPQGPAQVALVAEALAEAGDPVAAPYIDALAAYQPIESRLAAARLLARTGRPLDAVAALEEAFQAARQDPWPSPIFLRRGLALAEELGGRDPELALRLFRALQPPFSVRNVDDLRQNTLLALATRMPLERACVDALAQMEPHVPWTFDLLGVRRECYAATGHPLLGEARRDLQEFLDLEPEPFAQGTGQPE